MDVISELLKRLIVAVIDALRGLSRLLATVGTPWVHPEEPEKLFIWGRVEIPFVTGL